jgi:hypothetical protein
MSKALRLALMSVLVVSGLSIATPASANDCSDTKPGQQCGGCQLNPNFSSEDLRPIVCYI